MIKELVKKVQKRFDDRFRELYPEIEVTVQPYPFIQEENFEIKNRPVQVCIRTNWEGRHRGNYFHGLFIDVDLDGIPTYIQRGTVLDFMYNDWPQNRIHAWLDYNRSSSDMPISPSDMDKITKRGVNDKENTQ